MNLLTISLRSAQLGKKTHVNVLLPAGATRKNPARVLWALHGMTEDHTSWLRSSCIEVLAEKYNLCVVLPNADLSFYVDMAAGANYRQWIAEELREILTDMLPISADPKDHYIAGISMGGYGAYHIALNYPDNYNTAISLSGPMRIAWINRILADPQIAAKTEDGETVCRRLEAEEGIPYNLTDDLLGMASPMTMGLFHAMFGKDPVLTGNYLDHFHMARKLKEENKSLKLLAFCGTEDLHYVSNLHFAEHAKELGLDYELTTAPGAHSWNYWNSVIPKMLEKLFES